MNKLTSSIRKVIQAENIHNLKSIVSIKLKSEKKKRKKKNLTSYLMVFMDPLTSMSKQWKWFYEPINVNVEASKKQLN